MRNKGYFKNHYPILFFPILFLVAALTKRFHKSKQWGHDLISQTKVIDEYKLNQMLLKKVEGSL